MAADPPASCSAPAPRRTTTRAGAPPLPANRRSRYSDHPAQKRSKTMPSPPCSSPPSPHGSRPHSRSSRRRSATPKQAVTFSTNLFAASTMLPVTLLLLSLCCIRCQSFAPTASVVAFQPAAAPTTAVFRHRDHAGLSFPILEGRTVARTVALHATVASEAERREAGAPVGRQSLDVTGTAAVDPRTADSRTVEREIVRLGRIGRTDDALRLYEEVWDVDDEIDSSSNRKRRCKPTTRLMNAAIDACARSRSSNKVDRAYDILERAMNGGRRGIRRLSPNVFTFGSLMSCAARDRDAGRALTLLKEMQDKYSIAPNAVVYSTAISACGRSEPPRPDVALDLLREATSDPTVTMGVVGYNAAISALASAGEWRKAVRLLDEMEGGCGLHDVIDCGGGDAVVRADGGGQQQPEVGVANDGDVAAEALGEEDKVQPQLEHLLDPNVAKPCPDEVTYGTVMAACERAGEWNHVLRFADAIKRKGRVDPSFGPMDGLTITSALHACQQLGLADEALSYLDLMKGLAAAEGEESESGVVNGRPGERRRRRQTNGRDRKGARAPLRGPDEVAYRLAISACSRSRDGPGGRPRWADGIRLLGEMEEVAGSPPDVVAYTAAIGGCAEAGEWRMAFQLLDEMRDAGVEPNVVTYSAVISACATASGIAARNTDEGDVFFDKGWIEGPKEKALQLLRLMKSDGHLVKPNVFTYNAAIRACAEALDLKMAFALFKDLREEGLQPTVVTYGSLMTACERVGNLDAASRVIRMMKDSDETIKPNEIIYGAAISCCRKAGQSERALLLLRKMIKEGLTPNTATFNTVVMAQTEGKPETDKAVIVYKLMKSKFAPRGRPNRQTYNILIRALALDMKPNEAEAMLRAMQADGIVPDVDLYTATVTSYERTGQPLKALQLMESMEKDGYNFYEVKVLDEAFKKAVKLVNAVGRGLQPSSDSDEEGIVSNMDDDIDVDMLKSGR